MKKLLYPLLSFLFIFPLSSHAQEENISAVSPQHSFEVQFQPSVSFPYAASADLKNVNPGFFPGGSLLYSSKITNSIALTTGLELTGSVAEYTFGDRGIYLSDLFVQVPVLVRKSVELSEKNKNRISFGAGPYLKILQFQHWRYQEENLGSAQETEESYFVAGAAAEVKFTLVNRNNRSYEFGLRGNADLGKPLLAEDKGFKTQYASVGLFYTIARRDW